MSTWDETTRATFERLYDDYTDVIREAVDAGDENITNLGRRARLAELCDQLATTCESEAEYGRRMAEVWRTSSS